MRLAARGLGLLALALTLPAAQARAGLIFTIEEVGPDVVVTASGTVNTGGLALIGSWDGGSGPVILPDSGTIHMAPAMALFGGPLYRGMSGHTGDFGSGPVGGSVATSFSGDPVWLSGPVGHIGLPGGYSSGDQIDATMTFAGATLASLGLTPGTYRWTWDTGAGEDFVELRIVPAAAVPEPGSLALLASGAAGAAGLALRRRWRSS